MPGMAPNGAGKFFPTKSDLADILGRTDFDFSDLLEAHNFWVRCRKRFFSEELHPYFWKPLTCGYIAAGVFFAQTNGSIFLEAPNLWVRCRRRFFSQKNAPSFWKPLTWGGLIFFFVVGPLGFTKTVGMQEIQ